MKKSSFSKVLRIVIIIGALALGGAYKYHGQIYNAINHTSSTETTKNSNISTNDVNKKLLALTDQQSPGENQNYFWDNGEAKLENDDDVNNGSLKFSHDEKGRTSLAKGKLTYQMFENSKGSRQGTPLNPPNWPNKNPKAGIYSSLTGRTYHGFFYNRSHSISDSLGGKESYTSVDNFTTGTRTQNIGADQNGGMRAAEELAENYWKSNPNTQAIIHYQVLPIYNGNETIPRGSIVNEKSSDGRLNKQIIVINDAEGYKINYFNGDIIAKD